MSSARARFGASLACALVLTLVPAVTSSAAALPVSPAARAVTTVVAPTTDRTVPVVSRSTRIPLSKAALRDAAVRGKAVIAIAKRYAGIRYRAGGTTPRSGFDCSGYTRYVFAQLGISLPRVSRDQARWATPITRAQAVPGDLVFFHSSGGRIYHVSIYAGGNAIWHSPFPGQRVKYERIWSKRVTFGRVRV